MKGNVHSSYCKLKRRARSHPLFLTPLNKEIDCSSGVPAHTAVTFFDAVRWDSVEGEVASILWFPSANHLVKRRRLPTCCRRSGVIRNWGTPCPRTAGTRATSRYRGAMWRIILVVLHSNVVNIKIHTHCLFSQPTVTATPKSTKNGKPGYDDTTLPLMEKNQGQCVWLSLCLSG